MESHHSADTVESSDKGNGDEAKMKKKPLISSALL